MDFKLHASALEAMRRGFEQAPAFTQQRARSATVEAVTLLEGEVMRRTPTAHKGGGLRGSMFGETREFPQGIGVEGVVGTSSKYGPYVELGTKPHPVSDEGIAALTEWAHAQLGVSGDDAERVANAVAWKIRHHGTVGHFMFSRALSENESELNDIFDRAAKDIGRYLMERGATE